MRFNLLNQALFPHLQRLEPGRKFKVVVGAVAGGDCPVIFFPSICKMPAINK